MLRAIWKLVSKRNRDAPQRSERLVEDAGSSDQANNPDEPVQSAGQELEQSSGPLVRGTVKWFSPIKGYGFVVLSDGRGDVFLHASALATTGITTLQPGETLDFRVASGQRGPQVSEVISVDRSTASPPRPSRRSLGVQSDRQPLEASVHEMGTVKWYNTAKRFGFILRDGGGRDIFVHGSALERAGITHLNEGQRVLVGVAEGRKGPEAVSVRVISSGSDNV